MDKITLYSRLISEVTQPAFSPSTCSGGYVLKRKLWLQFCLVILHLKLKNTCFYNKKKNEKAIMYKINSTYVF